MSGCPAVPEGKEMTGEAILREFFYQHYITMIMVIAFSIKLFWQRKTGDAEVRYFWMTIICCFLLVIQDVSETFASSDPDLRFMRTLLSIIGYALRPLAAVGLLMVVCPRENRTWMILIPAAVNLAVNLTAFFSPIAFSFDEDYAFTRGPLGYVVFIVGILYMIQLLVLTWRRFYDRNAAERWILILCAVSCIGASVVDAVSGGSHLNEASMISAIFFYLFLRAHDNRLDPLTSLQNRFALYEDFANQDRNIAAVASLDMNGLKQLNDTEGHAAGDRALREIGRCLGSIDSRDTIAYRIGGDEFVVLFLQQGADEVQRKLDRVREDVLAAGCSLSIGWVMRENGESVESALHRSDQNMYGEKAVYYQQSGRNRRRS